LKIAESVIDSWFSFRTRCLVRLSFLMTWRRLPWWAFEFSS